MGPRKLHRSEGTKVTTSISYTISVSDYNLFINRYLLCYSQLAMTRVSKNQLLLKNWSVLGSNPRESIHLTQKLIKISFSVYYSDIREEC
jgi:hypothetical protein